jgi:hypothetical protein
MVARRTADVVTNLVHVDKNKTDKFHPKQANEVHNESFNFSPQKSPSGLMSNEHQDSSRYEDHNPKFWSP